MAIQQRTANSRAGTAAALRRRARLALAWLMALVLLLLHGAFEPLHERLHAFRGDSNGAAAVCALCVLDAQLATAPAGIPRLPVASVLPFVAHPVASLPPCAAPPADLPERPGRGPPPRVV